MSQLHFKKQFWALILSGEKRTTIRRWSWARVKPNSRCYAFGIGWLLIDAVEQIDLAKLTRADAKADGFDSVKSMRKTLFEFYPEHESDGRSWFRVTFRPEKVSEPAPTLLS